ncbi:MAG: LamG-like jellyroll fold domain-containing protein, partial [bacterium]
MPTPSRKFRSFRLNPSFRANRNRHRPLVDSLEDRTLLTCTLDSQGILQVLGTASADTINISLNSATQNIEVFENSIKTGTFALNSVTSIDIKAGAGNDTLSIARGFVINSTTDLGQGLDKFTGGDGDDTVRALDGQADTIDGGPGQDGIFSDSPDDVANAEFLNPVTTATDNQRQTIKIMVINFDPVVPSEGNKLMHEVFNWMSPQDIAVRYQSSMEKASGGAIKFDIVKWNNINEIPVFEDGFQYTPDQYVTNRRSNTNWHDTSSADFRKIVRENGVIDLINSGEVDEVWCIGDHFYSLPGESWMAGPNAFWINGPVYSDIPTTRAFACMGFSYERPDTLTHNMGHRTESTMNYFYGNWNLASPKTNWDKFSGNSFQSNGYSGVGTCHYPANGESDYDYANTRTVTSTADDFLNYPNLTGSTIPVSRTAWSKNGVEYQWEYLEWYFTRIPRAIGVNPDGRQNNWWKYLYNYNNYNTNGSARPLMATAMTTDALAGTKTTQTVKIAYSGSVFVNRSTLDDNDIEIISPSGSTLSARLVKVSSAENAPYLVGTYEIQPPGADWSTAPAGSYRVNLKAGQVADAKGNQLAAATLGAFSVRNTAATPLATTSDTAILLPFEGNTNGSAGETASTLANISFKSGKVGQAAYFTTSSALRYPTANNISPAAGTVEFFLKPDWPSGTVVPSAFFQVGNSFNNSLYMQIDGAYNVRLIQWGDDPSTSQIETAVERGVSFNGSSWRGGNWYHVAATWDETTREIAIYFNGVLAQKSNLGLKISQFA